MTHDQEIQLHEIIDQFCADAEESQNFPLIGEQRPAFERWFSGWRLHNGHTTYPRPGQDGYPEYAAIYALAFEAWCQAMRVARIGHITQELERNPFSPNSKVQ